MAVKVGLKEVGMDRWGGKVSSPRSSSAPICPWVTGITVVAKVRVPPAAPLPVPCL